MAKLAEHEVKLKNVRLSFADLFVPRAFSDKSGDSSAPRFSANFLIPKNTPEGKAQIEAVRAAIRKAMADKWGEDATKHPKLQPEKRCLRDGEPKDPDTGEVAPIYEGYEGHVYVSASAPADRPPVIIDSRKGADGKFPRLTAAAGRPYSGCYVNAVVRIWAQDNDWGKRVNASIEGVQFAAHGEAFGAKPLDADDVFDDLGGDDGFADAPSAAAEDDLI